PAQPEPRSVPTRRSSDLTFTAAAAGSATDHGYGTYEMTAAGTWTYTLDNSNATVQGLNVADSTTDTFTVTTIDGTAQQVTVTIHDRKSTRLNSSHVESSY